MNLSNFKVTLLQLVGEEYLEQPFLLLIRSAKSTLKPYIHRGAEMIRRLSLEYHLGLGCT